jgi:hypothetical protein
VNSGGDFMAVWDGEGGLRAQCYDRTGVQRGEEFRVSELGFDPAVAAGGGNFVVVFSQVDRPIYEVFAQRYDSSCAKLGNAWEVSENALLYHFSPVVAADPAGNFVVVWWNEDLDGAGILGQRYDSAGARLGDTFKVTSLTTTSFILPPAVAADSAGNVVVVWSEQGIFARRYDSAGAELGAKIQVDTPPAPLDATVAAAAGNFVVVWGRDGGILGQRFDSAGARLGAEFRVNTSTTSGQSYPSYPAVTANAAGDFVVVWVDSEQYEPPQYPQLQTHLRGQRYDSAGARIGGEFQVDRYVGGGPFSPAIAAHPAGPFVVVWASHGQDENSFDIFGRCFGCPAALVAAALPDPATAVGAASTVAKHLARLARKAQKRIEKGAAATGGRQHRQYEKACRQLEKLVAVATRADGKDTLGVPFEPVDTAVASLRTLLEC